MVIGVDPGSQMCGLAAAHLNRLVETQCIRGKGQTRDIRVARMIPEIVAWCKAREECAPPIQSFVIEQLAIFGKAGRKQLASIAATRQEIRDALKAKWPDAIFIDQDKFGMTKKKALVTALGIGCKKTITQDEADAVVVLLLAGFIK